MHSNGGSTLFIDFPLLRESPPSRRTHYRLLWRFFHLHSDLGEKGEGATLAFEWARRCRRIRLCWHSVALVFRPWLGAPWALMHQGNRVADRLEGPVNTVIWPLPLICPAPFFLPTPLTNLLLAYLNCRLRFGSGWQVSADPITLSFSLQQAPDSAELSRCKSLLDPAVS